MDPNKKRKRGDAGPPTAPKQEDENKRPRVRAQRKFAQGQGQSPHLGVVVKPSSKSGVGSASSGSSTASGPSSSNPSKSDRPAKIECPKTEDFLTFLCLRGTSLLPPELDHFNRVNLPDIGNSSDEDAASDNGKDKNAAISAKKSLPTTPIAPGAVRKSASNNIMTKQKQQQQQQNKHLPASVRALKKKYAERRLARSVVTNSMRPVTSTSQNKAISMSGIRTKTQEGVRTRSAQKLPARRSVRPLTETSKKSNVKVQSTNRKPSAATIIAKRKTRMATLTAASSRVSRMLTRLTPRGTSSAAFVKKTRALQLSTYKSLRGRDISVSSEEEEDEEEGEGGINKNEEKKKCSATNANSAKKNTPPKRKLKTRKANDAIQRKGSDADEETSSRDSSRRPPNLPPPKQQQSVKKSETGKVAKFRDARSESRESSNSKDSNRSGAGERPTRKTKEAATVYLNMLGQKMSSKKEDNDTISIESLSESTQGKRLEELGIDLQDKKSESSASGKSSVVALPIGKKWNDDSKTMQADTDDTKSDVDSEKSRKKKSAKKDKDGEKKKGGKHTLKELQDRLLEEAKKKMGSNPDSPQSQVSNSNSNAARSKQEGDSDTGDSDERITISQRTGYIQVKPRKSIDQMSNDEGQPSQQSSSASIGPNGRRLSKNGERTATPPRKILPKTSEQIERTPAGSPHLPVGVMGAALSSSRLTSSPMGSAVALKAAALVSGQMQAVPMISAQMMQHTSGIMGPNGNQHGVPLTQPLVINTSFAGGPMTNAQTVTMAPVQITSGQAGIIMSNTGMRMPMTAVPVQVRTTGGMPIIMPQIALPSGSIIQSMPANVRAQQQSNMVRPNYSYGPQQIITSQQPMTLTQIPVSMMQQITSNSTTPVYSTSTVSVPMSVAMAMSQPSNSMSRSNNSTDVTTSNIQPLVSPGPPMLSPQIGQQMQSQHYQQQQPNQVQHQQHQTQVQQQQNQLIQQNQLQQQQQQQQNQLQQQQQNQLQQQQQNQLQKQQQNQLQQQQQQQNQLQQQQQQQNQLQQHQQNQLKQQQQNQIQQQHQNQIQQHQQNQTQQQQQNQIGQQTQQNQMAQKTHQNQMPQQTQQSQMAQQAKQNQQYQQQQRLPVPQQQQQQRLPIPQQQQQQQPRARVQTTTSAAAVMPSGVTVTSGAVIRSVPPKMMGAGRISNANQPVRGKGSIQLRPTMATLPSQPLPQQLLPQQPINVPLQHHQQQQANKTVLQAPNNFSAVPPSNIKQPSKSDNVQPQQQQRGYATVRSVPNRPPVTAPQQSKPSPQPIPPLPTVPQSANGSLTTQTIPVTSATNIPTSTALPPPVSSTIDPLVSSVPVTTIAALPQHPLPPQAIEQINSRPNSIPVSQPDKVTVPVQPIVPKAEPKSKPIFSKSAVSSSTCVKSSASSPKTSTSKPTVLNSQKSATTSSHSNSKARYSLESHTKSFRVENEASPYAFEPEPVEVRPQMPYRVSGPTPTAHSTPSKSQDSAATASSSSPTKPQDRKPAPSQSNSTANAGMFSMFGGEGGPSIGSSIPIPDELAAQLAEQAAAEGAPSGTETTYFIPLSTGTGQSFGVAVKLGTEGPPGPNQKVIMKAKLVTQPVGRTVGARVIGARTTGGGESTVELTPQVQPQVHPQVQPKVQPQVQPQAQPQVQPKVEPSPAPFNRMPMASPASRQSSSSSSDGSESGSSSSSSDDEDRRSKAKRRKSQKLASKKKRPQTPDSSLSKSKPAKEEKLAATSPISSSGVSSAQSCLGSIEALEKFPKLGQHAHLVEAPVFRPSEKEFKDPMRYIDRIRREAEPFGICKIIPPSSFKPECNVDDDMRFTAYNQYIHRLMNRWGQSAKEMAAITKYLETQNVTIKPSNHPLVGGVEIDLPALYHAVQSFGGLTEVIQRKKWGKIADFLRVPKGTQDRGNKLDDVYCKFLLPYDTLSEVEREELLRLVEEEWEEKNKRKLERSKNEGKRNENEDSDDSEESEEEEEEESDDESGECVLKGKSTSLSAFFRVARNLMSMVFKTGEPEVNDVEEEYWRLVLERDVHMQVQQGSIDTGAGRGGEEFGFPTTRNSSCGRHPWNLKILSNNRRSLLRCMGPVMGVTVPTLHVGMLFSTGCWYRDPHGLPWIEYHHTGAPKVWYGIPDSHGIAFYTAMKQLVPTFCRKKPIWLPSDTAMVPPNVLVKYNVSCCRSVQEQGQFIVVFPRAYSSSVCTGYSVSESVYFAPRDYLHFAEMEFKNIKDTREPMMFPLSKLLLCVAQEEQTKKDTLKLVKPLLEQIRDNEYVKRTMISDMGVKATERINLKSDKKNQVEEEEYECETCSANLYVSFLCDVKEGSYYCHEHALEYLHKMKHGQRRHCKLLYTHGKDEITAVIKMVNQRLEEEDSDNSSTSADEIAIRRVSELKTQQQQQQAIIQDGNKSLINHPKPSGPHVPPGTSISVSSFSLVQHAKAKASTSQSSQSKQAKKDSPKSKKESDSSKSKKSSKEISDNSDENSDEDEESNSDESQSEEEEKLSKKSKSSQQNKNKNVSTSKSKAAAAAAAAGKKEAEKKKKEKEKEKKLKGKEKEKEKKAKKVESKASTSKDSSTSKRKNSEVSLPSRRKTKMRKAASEKTGNLASEILDMLLSASEESEGEQHGSEESSDESWK